MPIKGQSKTTKTRTCRFFHKNNTYSRKNLDRCRTRRIFTLRLCGIWRIKDNLQKYFSYYHHWSDEKWKSSMAGGGGNKKRYQYCTDSSGVILYLRALQGHSGRSLTDPTLQDNVVIPSNFFQYIYHVGCAINLHSIINSGLIPGGQSLSNRQTVFFLPVDPMDKNHKDLDTIDLRAPRHAQYMHKGWKKHQNTVYWIDINLALKKGLKFY